MWFRLNGLGTRFFFCFNDRLTAKDGAVGAFLGGKFYSGLGCSPRVRVNVGMWGQFLWCRLTDGEASDSAESFFQFVAIAAEDRTLMTWLEGKPGLRAASGTE